MSDDIECKCGQRDTSVSDVRARVEPTLFVLGQKSTIMRRRKCRACKETITTYDVHSAVIDRLARITRVLEQFKRLLP
jgi:transcriptional regulator NrdR family protein